LLLVVVEVLKVEPPTVLVALVAAVALLTKRFILLQVRILSMLVEQVAHRVFRMLQAFSLEELDHRTVLVAVAAMVAAAGAGHLAVAALAVQGCSEDSMVLLA
jgi:hypothetical protein